MMAIREKYTSQLVATDPQRLETATAAYDLHFTEQFLQLKQSLRDKGKLPISLRRTASHHPKKRALEKAKAMSA
ncbi:hypothetical protein ABBQ32_006488 [Trebouxia sp. C0010 RCD-2024]